MAGVQKHRASNAKNKQFHKARKTKHYGRDHDQIYQDLQQDQQMGQEKKQIDQTKPGQGQHYCISCARYFQSDQTLNTHRNTKKHKRGLKKMEQIPYSHKEAYEAGK